jgi:hypothetical protein
MLSDNGRRSAKDARAADARAEVCEALPGFADALAAGSVSTGHVDALANATRNLDEAARDQLAGRQAELLRLAAAMTVSSFDRRCRDLARRLDRDEGEKRLDEMKRRFQRAAMDRSPDKHVATPRRARSRAWSGGLGSVGRAPRHSSQRDDTGGVRLERLASEAFVDLVTGARAVDRNVPELCLHIDLPTLLDGLHKRSICETTNGEFLPPATIRRLACEAVVIPIVCDGDGVPIDVGAERRTATREQRRALRKMYRTCGHPGCQVPFDDCRIHHVIPWEVERLTDLANLLPCCA